MGTMSKIIDHDTGKPVADGRDYYVDKINTAWNKATDAIIQTGGAIAEAKKNLPHGEFEAMVKEDLPFTPQTARMLMAIYRHPVLSNRNHGCDLPPSWRTLYELTKLPEPFLRKQLADGEITPETQRKDVQKWRRELKGESIRNEAEGNADIELPGHAQVIHGDFRDVCEELPDDFVDLIFTDPPYGDEYVPLYEDLAQIAARVLKPRGSLIAYVGHHAIPHVLNSMRPHLRFWWTLAVHHNGASARLPGKWVFVQWKPMLWFVKDGRRGRDYVADMIESRQPDKAHHEWQQDASEALYYIEHLTEPDDVVLDPFCGSGTTIMAAVDLGRSAVGIEINEQRVNVAKGRINEHLQTTQRV